MQKDSALPIWELQDVVPMCPTDGALFLLRVIIQFRGLVYGLRPYT